MESIGQRIRRLRESRELRQVDFALMCGMGQSTLSDIESKNKDFSAVLLYAFAKALEVSTDEIMYGTQGETVGQSELIRIFAGLSQDQRDIVLSMVRGLEAANKPNIKAA